MLLKNASYLNSDFKIVHGDLWISNGKIHLEHSNLNDMESMDCSDYYIIPGLFNSHYHGYSLLAKGIAKDMKIEDWTNESEQGEVQKQFFENLDKVTSEEYQVICMKSYIEMVKNGITFVSESEPGYWPDIVAEGINKVGIRGLVDTYRKIENFYNKEIGNVSFSTHLLEEEDITEEALVECVANKKKYDSLFMTHCMENDWRRNLIYDKYDKSSIQLYEERNLLDDKTILFHGVFLNEQDIDSLSTAQASVVHCPVSNFWTGAGGIAPISQMLESNVNVCLGTDYASTDIWETMKTSYFLLKLNNPVNRFTAEDILKMATVNGAKAYKKENIGIIQEGYHADLVFIKKDRFTPDIDTQEFSTTVHNLLMETKSDSVEHVMVNGEWIMSDKKLLKINEEELNIKYVKLMDRIFTDIN